MQYNVLFCCFIQYIYSVIAKCNGGVQLYVCSLLVLESSHNYLTTGNKQIPCHKCLSHNMSINPFQPTLILEHTTVTDTCRRAYKTCKNWPLCSYVGWHQQSQPNAEESAQCAKMTTGANGQKACLLRAYEKHDAIWHHWAGKG